MKKLIGLFFGLAFVIGVNLYFRSFPVNFPQLRERARSIVDKNIQIEAEVFIAKRFSNLGPLARDKLIKVFISEYNKVHKQQIKEEVEDEYHKLKDPYQDGSGQTYLMELDCWHWARYVGNVLRHGYPGDRIVKGRQWDDLMLAPLGTYMPWDNFLFYLSAYLYRGFSLFTHIPLFTFLFYLPLFYSAIFITLLYLFCFYRWGSISAIFSCLFVGLAPICLFHSYAGWFDKDILNLAFPLLIVWSYLKSYDSGSLKSDLLWVFIASLCTGLFAFSWMNWWFIFLIIILFEAYSLANRCSAYFQYKVKDEPSFKKHLINPASFVVLTFLWIIIFLGKDPLLGLYSQVKGALSLNEPFTSSLWPNIYSTVGELKKASLNDIASTVGGPFLFILSLVSTLVFFLLSIRINRENFQHRLSVILICWMASMLFACSKGVRFSLFILIPLGISLGWVMSQAYDYFKNKKIVLLRVIFIAFMLGLVTKFLSNADISAKRLFPMMDDTWNKVLVTIKDNTPKESIINSWWDFGDWFKVVAQRRVIFDGQSQNTPQAYWMSRILFSQNEEEAVKMLRMLNNSGNNAFEIINKQLNDPYKTVWLLEKLITLNPAQASALLATSLPKAAAEKVSGLLFNRPATAYFIVDYTMLDKTNEISFIGNWDFSKAYIINNIDHNSQERITSYLQGAGLNTEEIKSDYQEASLLSNEEWNNWVSRRFKFYNNPVSGVQNNGLVYFNNGLVYNIKEQKIALYFWSDYKYKTPFSLFLLEKDKLKEIVYPNADLNYSVLITEAKGDYKAILLDRELAKTLFVRLYFLDGKGLKHFKPFAQEERSGNYIKVFEIVWD